MAGGGFLHLTASRGPENDPQPPDPRHAGIIAGDFVFFGNQNDVFAPGPGFDEDYAVQDAYNTGRNTFQEPLVYDFVAAAGGDVSYGYFTKAASPDQAVATNVPLFASAATAFLAAGSNCRVAPDDDAECDAFRAFSYERYLVVGDGDIASVTGEMRRVRGTPTGHLSGHVLWAQTAEAVPNARLFVFIDPDPGAELADVAALAEANLRARADVGLVDAIDADLGLDPTEDGDFAADLPPGDYRVVAQNAAGTALSAPLRLQVVAGGEHVLAPALPTPATVRYRVVDEAGLLLPAKVALVALDSAGAPLEGDGTRRVYMGDGRLGNGVRNIELTASGSGAFEAEPGHYRVRVSRGPEYGIVERDVTLVSGHEELIDAQLVREMDTSGWMSADMHLHAQPSFDSGMPLSRRVRTVAAEGVELGVSTDHDVESDYHGEIEAAALEQRFAHAIGAEITTLEQGHFIGFPLDYDALLVPDHGAHDWTCEPGGAILDAIRESGDTELAPEGPLAIVAHPRDGFFGYADQLGVDGYTMNRVVPFLEAQNPVFRTASCDFDASEVISAKRNDLTRTATVAEVVEYNRCLSRLEGAADLATLDGFCPELGPGLLAPCREGERYAVRRNRNRTRLAWLTTARILARTPEEQDANWDFAGDEAASEELCDPVILGARPIPEEPRRSPCRFQTGQVDDWFRWLERGLRPTQLGSSDSHNLGKEPGFPRTWFRSPTDSPRALSIGDAVASLRGGHALASYGPFVRASIGDKTFGDVVQTSVGREVELLLDVATASWFGVDRVEVYVNGRIVRELRPNEGKAALLDVHGKVTIEVPERDSWVVIIAMGLEDDSTMRPVSLDVPYGEVQLSVLAARAFGLIDSPTVQSVFPPEPVVPDWSPIFAYAVTNPIYLDVDGNGEYDAPLPCPTGARSPATPTRRRTPAPLARRVSSPSTCAAP
ncbi:MAG: PHP domain-containing protein [Polyangiaceae bacterium]